MTGGTGEPRRGGCAPFLAGLDRAQGLDSRTAAATATGTPTMGGFDVLANRVYNAFPGYNQGGAAGPTNTPFPTVRAVNYQTGEDLDCSDVNLLPSPRRSPWARRRTPTTKVWSTPPSTIPI